MIAGLIVLGVVVLLLLWAVAIYNGLVRLRALVKEGFSGITVQLRRRADLVPNLVSTVEGYATHEREVLTHVTAHRGDRFGNLRHRRSPKPAPASRNGNKLHWTQTPAGKIKMAKIRAKRWQNR